MRICSLALPFAYGAVMVAACADDGKSAIKLGMSVPQGLLDEATSVDLEVIPGTASCDTAKGRVSGSFDADEVEAFSLGRDGCAAGASWCLDITLERDGEPRVFSVVAKAALQVIGRGCAKVAIDQDPVEVNVNIVAELEDRCCNDGVIQLGEQCDTSAAAPTDCGGNPVDPTPGSCGGILPDAACECDCLAKEILVSEPGTAPSLTPDNKNEIALAFAGGGAGAQASMLRAVFTDTGTATPEINFRVFQPDLYPAAPPFNQQLRLPTSASCGNPSQAFSRPLEQVQPAIARASDSLTAVVWADSSTSPGNPKIFGTWLNNQGCTDIAPLQISAGSTPASFPAIAGGPSGSVLVVWAEGAAVRGRIWSVADGGLTPAADVDIATQIDAGRPKVAGSQSGWVVAYASGSNAGDVSIKTVSTTGGVGAETRVNIVVDGPQDQPDVAMQPDGQFAVVWRTGEDVVVQRYNQDGDAISGDQDNLVTVDSPPAERPRIAASTDTGSFYALGWVTPATGQVWGRMVDASGALFLRNHVDGLLGDFVVNHPAVVASRFEPAIAIGSQRVVYGFGTSFGGPPNVFMRGFPLPPE